MSQLADVQKFIDASRFVRAPGALRDLLDAVSRELGFDHFALLHHLDLPGAYRPLESMRRGAFIALGNYPQCWAEEYSRRKIVRYDPVLIASHRTAVGFSWEDVPKLIRVKSIHRTVKEDTIRAGIGEGYTVPAHVPGEPNGSCSFAMRVGRSLPERNLPFVQLIGAFAFQAARTILVNARARQSGAPPRRLTERQLQCTVLVGRGYTEQEIASALGISDETVKRHLKEARQIYDVRKSIQLVANAVYDGQIDLADLLKN